MHRWRVASATLACLLIGTVAHAQIAKEVTLFGQKYVLEANSLGGQYANGLTVVQPPAAEDNKGAHIRFVQGETPEKDRLFVATAFRDTDEFRAHQFYLLTGAGANGVFNQQNSNLTEFFGGAVGRERGGRIATVTFISDVDTGVKRDRNLALTTFTGDDHLRFYDLDTLTGDYIGDAVHSLLQRCLGGDDEGMPSCGFIVGAPAAGGVFLFIGRGEGEGPQLGIMDPNRNNFFNALTNLGTITEDQTIPYDIDLDPQDMVLLGGNEYLILGSSPAGLPNDRDRQVIYRARITIPENPANATPGSIRAEILAQEEILSVDANKDLLGVGVGGLRGMAVGRLVNGVPRLYFSTRSGLLITANPVAN